MLGSIMLIACAKSAPPPTVTIAAPSSHFGDAVPCTQGSKASVLMLDDAGLHARIDTAAGNTVSWLGHDVTIGANDSDVVFADALARFADFHALDAWVHVDVTVKTPDARTSTEKAQIRIDRALSKRVEAARAGGMRFPGETLATSANRVAYVRPGDESRAPFLVGDGRWRDIDLVAFESVKSGLGKSCGVEPLGNFKGDVPKFSSSTTSHVELYDRRAGTRVDETTFTEVGECPTLDAGTSHAPNEDAIRAWITARLERQ